MPSFCVGSTALGRFSLGTKIRYLLLTYNFHADKLTMIGLHKLLPKPHVSLDSLVKIKVNFTGSIL